MLPWLRSAPSNREKFFLELLSFVTILHVVILFFALLYSTKKEHQHITLHTPITDATAIVFVPLQKHITAKKSVQSSEDLGVQAPKKMISYDEYEKHLSQKNKPKSEKKKSKKAQEEKKVVQEAVQKKVEQKSIVSEKSQETVKKSVEPEIKKSEPIKKIAAVKKEKPATFLVTKKTASKKKKDTKNKSTLVKENSKKIDSKKSEEKKSEKQKEVEQKKDDFVEQQPLEPAQKDEPVKQEQVLEKQEVPTQQESIPVQEPVKSEIESAEPETMEFDLSNVLFVGTQDLDTLEIQQAITQSILQYWKPPVGLSKNKTCQVTITLSAQGVVQNTVVSKTSGVPSFDICARSAVVKAVYPKEVWNKKITITLG